MVTELDDATFDKAISNGKVIVDFWATWCPPCKMLAPIFEEASKSFTDITFGKVDVDASGNIAQKYSVMSIPTLICFKSGKEVGRISGAMPKDALVSKINSIFG